MGADFRVASVILPKISQSKRGKLRPIFEFYFLAFGGGSSDLGGGEPGPDVQDHKLIDHGTCTWCFFHSCLNW